MPTANLTNEGWPARAQTQRGAQGSNEVGGIAAGTLVSPFSFIPPQVSPLKDPGRRPGGATQRLLGPGLGSCVEDLSSTPERLIKNDGGSRVVHDACMAMGTRDGEQEELFVTHQQLRTEGHPYYVGVNKVLAEHGLDRFVEALCRKFYAKKMGRAGITRGLHFRCLLLGYFEGIDSELSAGAAGRPVGCADHALGLAGCAHAAARDREIRPDSARLPHPCLAQAAA